MFVRKSKFREVEECNRAQADMISGYIALISAAQEAGVTFWWEEGPQGFHIAKAQLGESVGQATKY